MRKTKNIFLRKTLVLIGIIFLIGHVSAICCERTDDGGICLDVGDERFCDESFRVDDTACESTQYCSTGTCVNIGEGICMSSSSSACDPNLGGFWYDNSAENLPECQIGCCLIGEGATLTSRITCNKLAVDIGTLPDFRESITTLDKCLLSAGPTTKGACVFQTDIGRDCTVETKEKCDLGEKEFHVGLLCSAPELGTICTMTKETMCVEGKNEVYFIDNCGNLANVYNSALVDNIDYWTHIKDPASSEICGYGSSNINSPDCGNCIYGGGGSTCGSSKGTGVNPSYGDYICRDLRCTYNGEIKEHGSSWCSQPIDYFETAKPGDLSYRLYCYDGEVQWELCGNLRDGLCKEGDAPGKANCLPNMWQDCFWQNNSKDCLDTQKRDCVIKEGISRKDSDGEDILLLEESGSFIKATCVARYPPGFNFWEPDSEILGNSPMLTPKEICMAGSMSSTAGYYMGLFSGGWIAKDGKCFEECIESCKENIFESNCRQDCFSKCPSSEAFKNMPATNELTVGYVDLNENWARDREDFCISLGDCGVTANYIQEEGYYSWKELFIGNNITQTSIPRADNYQ